MNANNVYMPVYIVLFLRNLKNFRKDKLNTLKRLLKGWFKSCAYVALFASSYPFTGTFYVQNMVGVLSPWTCFLVSFLFTWAVFLDSKSRWSEVSVWVLGQWIEGFLYSLKKREYIGDYPNAYVIKYEITAIFNHLYLYFNSFRNLLWLLLLD